MSELTAIEQRLATVERELAELKSRVPKQRPGNPWKRMQGMLANEPLFDEWRQAVEDYRRQRNEEDLGLSQ
ncbi:MAG TPA: hypothetical protein VK137_12115 [Planctomycetaceae bacterium]|nr:hypothetical protein [Planctomycetaceae bacterium]